MVLPYFLVYMVSFDWIPGIMNFKYLAIRFYCVAFNTVFADRLFNYINFFLTIANVKEKSANVACFVNSERCSFYAVYIGHSDSVITIEPTCCTAIGSMANSLKSLSANKHD